MFNKEKLEEKIQRTDYRLKEFSVNLQRLENDYQKWLEQLGLTTEQLENHIENPDNFSEAEWNALQQEKKHLDEKLNLQLNSVVDPVKTKQTIAERSSIQSHWLFVR